MELLPQEKKDLLESLKGKWTLKIDLLREY